LDVDQSQTEISGILAADQEGSEGFLTLLGTYPRDSTMALEEAERLFGALSIEDRRKAIRSVKIYAEDIKRRGRSHPMDLARWLRSREFDVIDRMATAKEATPSSALAGGPVFVSVESDLWLVLVDRNRREKGRDPPNEIGGKRGWSFHPDWIRDAEVARSVTSCGTR
jgi:hypothetical protein